MKNRVLHLPMAEVLIDPKAAAARVAEACRRPLPMRATGLCQVGEVLLIPLEQIPRAETCEYVFSLFAEDIATLDDVTASVNSRFYAGFTTLGAFDDGHSRWGFFVTART
jgi:hypothetical protein